MREGKCQVLPLWCGEIVICGDFFPLKLGNLNVILGIQWLEKLGLVTTNWKLQIMQFVWGGKKVELEGDPTLTRLLISMKDMARVISQEGKLANFRK